MANLKNTRINTNEAIGLPSGTNSQRPSSASLGMMRYNTEEEIVEVYNGTEWIEIVVSGNAGLYAFSEATFTPGGSSGRFGPSLTEARNGLSGPEVDDWKNDTAFFNVSGGIQEWTVPANGTYRITSAGAEGGGQASSSNVGGRGAEMEGNFDLTEGTLLRIIVGQRGGDGAQTGLVDAGQNNAGGGAGGGSFVYFNSTDSTPLIAAGGGGGAESPDNGRNGTSSTSGTDSTPDSRGNVGPGGTNGNPGANDPGGASYHGGPGAGWNGRSTRRDSGDHGEGGYSFPSWEGGRAGPDNADARGGFGGGGGPSEDNGAAGGGGGYSGGGSANYSESGGGGGGSFNSGTNQSNSSGANSGDGFVRVSLL